MPVYNIPVFNSQLATLRQQVREISDLHSHLQNSVDTHPRVIEELRNNVRDHRYVQKLRRHIDTHPSIAANIAISSAGNPLTNMRFHSEDPMYQVWLSNRRTRISTRTLIAAKKAVIAAQNKLNQRQRSLAKKNQEIRVSQLNDRQGHIVFDTDKIEAALINYDPVQYVAVDYNETNKELLIRVDLSGITANAASPGQDAELKYLDPADMGEDEDFDEVFNDCGERRHVDGDEMPEIAIPDASIFIRTRHYDNGEVERTWGYLMDEGYYGYSDSTPMIHPHALSGAPCLGDFDNPITQALKEYDVETFVAILIEFLSQYDQHDCAGCHAGSWTYAPIEVSRSGRALNLYSRLNITAEKFKVPFAGEGIDTEQENVA